MDGSLGTALRNARLEKKITIEEAARVTKIRPERIMDLECDEYTRFPSLAYARSFLILYAKYLEFDVSKYQTMDVGNPAGVGDYQYLQSEAGVDSLRFTRTAEAPAPKPILFRALVVFVAGALLGVFTLYWLMTLKRLPVEDLVQKHQKDDRAILATPEPTAAATVTPIPVRKAIPLTSPTATITPAIQSTPPAVPFETPAIPPVRIEPEMRGSGVLPAMPVTSGTESAPVATLPVSATPAANGTDATPTGEPPVRPALPVTNGTGTPAIAPTIAPTITPAITPTVVVSESSSAGAEPKPDAAASGTAAPLAAGTATFPSIEAQTAAAPTLAGTSQPAVAVTPEASGSAEAPVPPSIPATVPGVTGSAAIPATATATATPTPASKGKYEVRLRASKKIWITVTRDEPDSAPIFDGLLAPGGHPLSLKGNRLWIKPKDPKDRNLLKIWTDSFNVSTLPDGYRVP